MQNTSSFQTLFTQQVKIAPNQIAVIADEQSITYQELNLRSNQLAHYLIQRHNIKRQNIVAVHQKNSIELIITLLAILKTGATYLPLDSSYPTARKYYMIENARCNLVITDRDTTLTVDCCPVIEIENLAFTSIKSSEITLQYSLDDHIYVLYTSGSTGKPKGVLLRQTGVMNMLINWYCTEYNMNNTDVNLVFSSIAYDLTKKNILSALLVGATIVLSTEKNYQPQKILQNIAKHKATIINATPSAFYPLLDFMETIDQLSTLRWIFLGGEKINCQRLMKLLPSYPAVQVVNTYGPTECSDVACAYTLTEADILDGKEIPLGKPIKNVKVFILDEALNIICEPMTEGEVYLAGCCVGDGYINQTTLRNERFLKNLPKKFRSIQIDVLYRVGDIGYWDNEGRLHFIGRVDDQVKLRGNRIELTEIDHLLEQQQEIKQAVTVMVEKNQQQMLVSFCLENAPLNIQLVKKQIEKFLPQHMCPNNIISLHAFPLTPNAKVDKHALRKMASELK